jgi:hypothetical protein
MVRRWSRLGIAALAAAMTAVLVPAGPVLPVASAAASLAVSPATGSVPGHRAGIIVLINGDRLTVAGAREGRATGTVLPGTVALAGMLVSLGVDGRSYEVPVDALPYLGRGLDPSLFDIAALLAAESGGRLPVRIGYHGRLPALPGVTITSAARGVAAGYLTGASARVFGAALARQYLADRTRASYGSDGMFSGGVTVSLAGTSPQRARVMRPGYVMHTVTVEGTDLAGKPDTGDVVWLLNVDNGVRYNSYSAFYRGSAKFSVPAGHYFALTDFLDLSHAGALTAQRVVTLPQVTVVGNAAVRVSARAADSEVTMATPRPAQTQATELTVVRRPEKGVPCLWAFYGQSPVTTWIAPAATPVATGQLQVIADGWLTSPARAASAYEYDLAFQDPEGVIPAQHYIASPAALATVSARYYSAASLPAWLTRISYFPAQWPVDQIHENGNPELAFLQSPLIGFRMPQERTEYTSAGPGLLWTSLLYLGIKQAGFYPLFVQDSVRTYLTGERVTEDWNGYPQHPGIEDDPVSGDGVGVDALNPAVPAATRAGNKLTVILIPFDDNVLGHIGPGFSALPGSRVSGSYQIDQNGVQIAGGSALQNGGFFWSQVTISPNPATVRLALNTARSGARYPLSTQTHTVWTWHTSAQAGQAPPAGWQCPQSATCSVQPMLALRYNVPGMGLDGSAAPGAQVLDFSAGRLPLARPAKITSAKVQVSFDNGTTWQDAAVASLGAGNYRATYAAPAGSYVTIRTTATDSGGSVTETITRAYRISAGVASHPQAMTAACPLPEPGHERCFALYVPQYAVNAAIAAGVRGAAATPAGLSAADIESAYKLPVSRNPEQTIAVVDAYGAPGLAADLNVYRTEYKLGACTLASGCLRVVNQQGVSSPLPPSGVSNGWALETALDVSMVSAACPHCKILVVEADDDTFASLAAAENTAARLGAQVMSNSYGGPESGLAQSYAKAYHHRGHTIVVASGDGGFGPANFPANLQTVTAVGGTELTRSDNPRGWSEQVWNAEGGAGASGCSAYVAKPPWQHDPHCAMRTVTDVSAVAWDVAIYTKSYGGWLTIGGTSAAAPLIAGVYGLAGNAATIKPGYEYRHAGSLFDITKGTNVISIHGVIISEVCGGDYLCVAKKGYDGPTGLGTPDGTGAF